MENEEDAVAMMESQIKQWEAKLNELALRTSAADTEAKREYRRRLDDLTKKCQLAHLKLDAFEAGDSGKWADFRRALGIGAKC